MSFPTFPALLSLVLLTVAQEDAVTSEIELITYDLLDQCTDTSIFTKRYLLGVPTYDLDSKVTLEVDNANYVRSQSEKLLGYVDDVPYDLERNWTLLTKSGNFRLAKDDITQLLEFSAELEYRAKVSRVEYNGTNFGRQGVLDLLERTRDATALEHVWSAWLGHFKVPQNYSAILDLVNKAAQVQGEYSARSYWEMLVDVEDGYSKAEGIWEELEPLYEKLHGFVAQRLGAYYDLNITEIPVHLLGSTLGDDWSKVADVVLPYPQLLHDLQSNLGAMPVQKVYRLSERFSRDFGMGTFGRRFWKGSFFDAEECRTQVLNYCNEDYSEVFTCNKTSYNAYLTSQEVGVALALEKRDFYSYAQSRLRYSVIKEALSGMASLCGISNLVYNEVLPEDTFTHEVEGENNRMSALLLTALRILPKLAYYYSVDMWRLQELENPSDDPDEAWRSTRLKYQKVVGGDVDYFMDEYVASNKPYLSKFLALVLQFQILNYHQVALFDEKRNLASVLKDENLEELLENVNAKSTPELIEYYYSLDDISAYPLTDFFSPLDDYLENAPATQAPVVTKPPITTTTTRRTTTTSPPKTAATTKSTTSPKVEVPQAPRNGTKVEDTGGMQQSGIYAVVAVLGLVLVAIIAVRYYKNRRRRQENERRYGT